MEKLRFGPVTLSSTIFQSNSDCLSQRIVFDV